MYRKENVMDTYMGKITSVELERTDAPIMKDQERKALEQIKKIVEELGKNSYIGAAFEGCFEIAEENIDNDSASSIKQEYERAREDAIKFKVQAYEYKQKFNKAQRSIEQLEKELDQEMEWKPYEMKENVSQEDYNNLMEQSDTRYLTDEEAKKLLYDWYGFASEKVTILNSVPIYEINRHGGIRKVGEVERKAAYNSTDWNYIRFDCGAMTYELYNDTLSFFVC